MTKSSPLCWKGYFIVLSSCILIFSFQLVFTYASSQISFMQQLLRTPASFSYCFVLGLVFVCDRGS